MDIHKYPLIGPFIQEIQHSGRKLHINRPYITACRRAIAYKATETARTDPTPWYDDVLAHASAAIVPAVLHALKTQGWNITPLTPSSKNSSHYSQWRPHENVGVNAIPDAFGSHPEHTSGLKTVITTTWQPSPDAPLYQDLDRLNMLAAFLKAHSKEPTVKADAPAVIATLFLHPHRLDISPMRPRDVQRHDQGLQAHLQPLSEFFTPSDHSVSPDLPARDYAEDSPVCTGCPWRTLCRPTG